MRFSVAKLLAASSLVTSTFADGSVSGHDLRIMPMGASITTGYGSTSGNGYRLRLSNLLEAENNTVSYVGSQTNGNMTSNAFEAWSGFVISQLLSPAQKDVPVYRPNVVLILLGNNDCKWNLESGAPERMGNLTSLIFSLEPKVTILVAQLPPNTVGWVDENIVAFNEAVVPVLRKQRAAGHAVWWVDTHTPLNKTTDMYDDTHPNDSGFEKIGNVFFQGMKDVLKKGWVVSPAKMGSPASRASLGSGEGHGQKQALLKGGM